MLAFPLATGLALAATLVLTPLTQARASVITVANPNVAAEIGARLRWGGTGWEAAVFDSAPSFDVTNATLNPPGTPAWVVGRAYGFQVSYAATTGTLGLSVDFDRNGLFGVGEMISRSVFLGTPSYAGQSFNYLSISGVETGNAASRLGNLAINGVSQGTLAPAGNPGNAIEVFYAPAAGSVFGDITITGEITFLSSGPGQSQERPSWNFSLRGPAALPAPPAQPVPEPASLLLLLGGVLGLTGLRRGIRASRMRGSAA